MISHHHHLDVVVVFVFVDVRLPTFSARLQSSVLVGADLLPHVIELHALLHSFAANLFGNQEEVFVVLLKRQMENLCFRRRPFIALRVLVAE